jgi:hypothetical protein
MRIRMLLICYLAHKYTPNVTANFQHAGPNKCVARAMWKNLKLSSNNGDYGSKKCKGGSDGSLNLAGVWSQAVVLC